MVAGEVGENVGAELQAEDPLLVDPVGTHFHHRLSTAGIAHLGEQAEQIEGLWRGPIRRDGARAEVVGDRADHAHLLVTVEQVLDQMGDGRLPVGAVTPITLRSRSGNA